MPRNFLEGCEAVEALREDVAELTPEQIDMAFTQANITADSEAGDLKYVQEQTGIDSIAAINAAEAAEVCQVCQDLSRCALGKFLSEKL